MAFSVCHSLEKETMNIGVFLKNIQKAVTREIQKISAGFSCDLSYVTALLRVFNLACLK